MVYYMIGIYFIYSKSQNKYYIGKSTNIQKRFWKHLSDLKLNHHHSKYLQNVYNKYGLNDLTFKIIEECSEEETIEKEKYYIKKYNCFLNGFNGTTGGDYGAPGRKFSQETLKKMSERMKGENNPQYQAFGDKNPNSKITKDVAQYLWFYLHSNKTFPKIQRKQFIGHYNITVDIYKKIQRKKTWNILEQEINFNDDILYQKTVDFIKSILSEA